MIKVNVVLDHTPWKKKIKSPEIYLKKKLNKLSKVYPFKNKSKEFSILLTNNKMMKDLNKKFRKKNNPTDVLSFPFKKNKRYLGDIAVSYEIVNKRSKRKNFKLEFDKMWIHGYLHLVGYDHKKIKDYKKMYNFEKLILNYLHKKN
tara:strand:+ start:232 stop:669 length:438 start_codon:yes stop_codon:yes gene_type:complete